MNNFIKTFAGFLVGGGIAAFVVAATYLLDVLFAFFGGQSILVENITVILGILVSFVFPSILFFRFRTRSPLLAKGIAVGTIIVGILGIWFWLIVYGILPWIN